MTPLVLFHRADFDGVCSAAIVKKFVPDCELYGIDYGDPFPWDKVRPVETSGTRALRRVYLVDFSLPPDDMKKLAECCDLVWIDHHKSAIEACRAVLPPDLPGLRLSSKAACELVWGWFEPNHCADDASHPFVPDFHVTRRFCTCNLPEAVRLLGRYDVFDEKNPEWARIEAFQFGLRSCDGIYDPSDRRWQVLLDAGSDTEQSYMYDLLEGGSAILRYRDQEAKSLCADGAQEFCAFRNGLGNLNWFFGSDCAEVLGQDDGGKRPEFTGVALNTLQRGSWLFKSVWDPAKHDAMCVYGQLKDGRWRVSLYSTKPEVDCGAICKAFGGGGHRGAAGFICDELPWEK